MKTIEGDLIELAKDGKFDVIIHGCNCMNTMDAGIAEQIKYQFPSAYEADLKTKKADKTKLGTCSYAIENINGRDFYIINAYTQYDCEGEETLIDYNALRSCMKWVKQNYSGKRIGIPKIGTGLAQGDWAIISNIISEELANEDLTLVIKPKEN